MLTESHNTVSVVPMVRYLIINDSDITPSACFRLSLLVCWLMGVTKNKGEIIKIIVNGLSSYFDRLPRPLFFNLICVRFAAYLNFSLLMPRRRL